MLRALWSGGVDPWPFTRRLRRSPSRGSAHRARPPGGARLAVEIKLSLVDQTKIVTAASELARNLLVYGGGGEVRLTILQEGIRRGLRVRFRGPRPGHRGHRPGHEGRLHHAARHGPGPGRGETAGERLSSIVSKPGEGTRSRSPVGSDRRTRPCTRRSSFRSPTRARRARRGARRGSGRARPAATMTTSRGWRWSVTELAKNLDLHTARGGELLLRKLDGDGKPGWKSSALDNGAGTANFSRFMRDGFSTAGTPGTGLWARSNARRRFRGSFPSPAMGTDFAQPGLGPSAPGRRDSLAGGSGQPADAQRDRCRATVGVSARGRRRRADDHRRRAGHGPAAAEASRPAVETFAAHKDQPLPT